MLRIKNTFLLITVLFISACGYHLRGSIDLPEELKRIYMQGASAQLNKIMQKTLKSSGGKLVDKVQQAGIVVAVVKEKMDRRVLSLSSTGRANEYQIIYTLNFNLLDAEGNSLTELQHLEINRDYFNDQEQILAKNIEEQIIRDEIYRKAVQSIISRSRIALERSNKI
ncbi:MAG: hypothetical protein GQ532_01235 [Methylomarinum sp.]|nr:hypothetical protein [Methylomarinum sp.]